MLVLKISGSTSFERDANSEDKAATRAFRSVVSNVNTERLEMTCIDCSIGVSGVSG